MQHLSLTLERRSRIGRYNNKYSIDGGPMFPEFTLTPTRTAENTVKKETVKIADKSTVCRHLKQMKSYAWKFLRQKFSQLFFSCYVRILEQGSKIHGEKSQSQLCWSIFDFLRALLVSF